MELDDRMERRLEEIRRAILRSPDLPLPRPERERAAEYELRVAEPGRASVSLDVDVVRGGIGPDGDASRTVRREVEITPQIVAESPDGIRVFVAWNHVARTFVVWLTRGAARALRDGRLETDESTVRRLPLADGSE